MEVGEYVRTDKGEIGKLKELKLNYTKGKRLVTYYTYREVEENLITFDNTNITQRFVDGSCYYLTDDEIKNVEESIIKSSPNIIDILEVGDYVNGYLVIEKDINNELRYIDLKDRNMKYVKYLDIKSILTKEQFKNMEYEVKQ